jgi:hypothetical protein
MKKLILMLSVALMLAPAMSTFADEAPAKPKKKLQMKTYMNQLDKAKADATKNEVPMLVFVILDGDDKSTLMKRFLFNNKIFKQLAQENFATLILKGKKAPKGGLVDKKSFKNWDFVEKNIMSDGTKSVDDTADKLSFYPGAFIVSPDGEKKLADVPKYNPELGFGAWAMDVAATLEKAGIEINKFPELEKAMANPQPDIKMSAGKGKKK